jgi:uridine kinase
MAQFPIPEILRRISVIRVFRNVAVVAVEGPSGAGKSTLARELVEAGDQTALIPGDDFYRVATEDERRAWTAEEGARKYFDWERLELEVLGPLSRTGRCRYQRYDWASGKLSEPVQLPNAHVVLIEGVYSFRPELRRYYDFSIMVDTPQAERLRRWKDRGDPEEQIERWNASEELYFQSTRPEDAAEMVISGAS